MQAVGRKRRLGAPSPAMVVAIVALVASLSGSAYAALGKNSVGPRQLKAKAVKTGKIANNAINGRKVRDNSLTGSDINLGKLGTVPSAFVATYSGNANTLGGHAAACPPATALIRGVCYDTASNPAVGSVKAAADGCAAKGGYLPSPLQLYSIRGVINLGTGTPPDYQYSDAYYANTTGVNYRTVVVDGTGQITEVAVDSAARYVCAYPLVR